MNAITKGRSFAKVLTALFAVVLFAVPATTYAQYSFDGGCCDYGYTFDPGASYSYTPDYGYTFDSGSSYSYTPDYGYTFDPSYTYEYFPSYSSSYYPDYASSYYPDYSSSYYPDYASSYYPDYSSSYYPDYASTYYPSYNSSYYPSYADTYAPDYSTYAQAPYYQGSGGSYYTTSGYGGGSSYTPSYPRVSFSTVPIGRPTGGVGGSQQQNQTQGQDQGQSQSSTNINSNPNTNTNTNVNNINVNVPAQTQQVVYQPIVQYPVQYQYQQQYQAPTCTIYINGANSYGSNQLATLTWSATNATSAFISPNVGTVSISGSRTVYPIGNTVYTMTVYGYNGQSATCQSAAYVAPVPQVSLTQIPYTGFDFGTTGNAIYWASLVAFALAAAYLLVYYRGGAAVFAGNVLGRSTVSKNEYTMPARVVTQKVVETPKAVIAPVAKKEFVLPVASSEKVTTDSMSIQTSDSGLPRIIINRD